MRRRWHIKAAVAGLLLLVLAAAASAGTEDDCPIDVGEDFVDLLTAPADWGTQEWLAAGAVGAVTAGLVVSGDEAVYRASVESSDHLPYAIVGKMAWLGKWYGRNDINPLITFGVVVGGMWAVGEASDDAYLVRTSAIAAESYLFTGAITIVSKFLFGRSRPYTGEGPHRWRWVGRHDRDRRSFPSGHAASAFSMATAISRRYTDWWVQVPAYTLATGMSFQRIDAGVHWTSDVLIGAALGFAVSTFLVQLHTCDDTAAPGTPSPTLVSFGFSF